MEVNSSDLSARLLATENLTVIRARTRTASFDIKSRVLTLPMWKEMTPEIEDMLVGHEVGHALYTGEKYMEPIMENPKMQGYLNVLEDVRIEKLIKRKYPGLRKRMNEGYKQLNDRDFFGIKKVPNLDDLLLIDKINLYFKAGFQCGVTFNADERVFVNRAERTETVEDVIELAHDVWKYSKEQVEERKKRMKAENPQDEDEEQEESEDDFDGFDDFDYDDSMEDEFPESRKGKPILPNQPKPDADDEDLESKTDRAFANKLEDLVDDSTEYVYWKIDTVYYDDPVIGYKTVLNETKSPEQWDNENSLYLDYFARNMGEDQLAAYRDSQQKDYEKFKTESTRTVNYLVKEFEMKKSAQMFKRAQTSKVGSLDMRKVYAYKLKDDLFKRVTTLPQGKNHGMIMLVDWSGSMDHVLRDTLKQVVNLAMFCSRVQIPYRVLAFTSCHSDYEHQKMSEDQYAELIARRRQVYASKATIPNLLRTNDGYRLLELFSSRMTTSEFNSMVRRVVDYRFTWNKGYETGGTPLTEALFWVYNNIGDYIKNNGVEKMTFITLTDGVGDCINGYNNYLKDTRVEIVNGAYKRIKVKNLIRDEATQKTYELHRYAGKQTEMILRMIKDRYNVSLVGFYICVNRRSLLSSALHANLPDFNGDTSLVIDAWRKDFKLQGFASLKNTGRDDLFIIPQSSTKIEDGELEVKNDAHASSIAKNFGKYLNVKKTSRVLLNRFVALVA